MFRVRVMVLKKMKVKLVKPVTVLWLKGGPEMVTEHNQQEDENSRSTLFHHQVIEKEGKTKLNNYTVQHNETESIDRLSYI